MVGGNKMTKKWYESNEEVLQALKDGKKVANDNHSWRKNDTKTKSRYFYKIVYYFKSKDVDTIFAVLKDGSTVAVDTDILQNDYKGFYEYVEEVKIQPVRAMTIEEIENDIDISKKLGYKIRVVE